MHDFKPWREFIGKPYESPPHPPETFDCYQLVVWVREICFGIKTPLIVDPSFICAENMAQLIELHHEREIYCRVDKPEPSDIMLFDSAHVGVVVEGGVLSAVATGMDRVVYFDWSKMRRFFWLAYPVRLRVP